MKSLGIGAAKGHTAQVTAGASGVSGSVSDPGESPERSSLAHFGQRASSLTTVKRARQSSPEVSGAIWAGRNSRRGSVMGMGPRILIRPMGGAGETPSAATRSRRNQEAIAAPRSLPLRRVLREFAGRCRRRSKRTRLTKILPMGPRS